MRILISSLALTAALACGANEHTAIDAIQDASLAIDAADAESAIDAEPIDAESIDAPLAHPVIASVDIIGYAASKQIRQGAGMIRVAITGTSLAEGTVAIESLSMGADLLRRQKADRFQQLGFGRAVRIDRARVGSPA